MTDGQHSSKLDELQFDYNVTKSNKVFIYWHNKHVVTLSGKQAQKFLRQIDGFDVEDAGAQLVMARFTGNFKHGNERDGKNKRR